MEKYLDFRISIQFLFFSLGKILIISILIQEISIKTLQLLIVDYKYVKIISSI